MKNLEQVRAKNALDALGNDKHFKGSKDGDPLTGFPALIIGNGLLATIAFAQKSKGDWSNIVTAIAEHLASEEIGLLKGKTADANGLRDFLCEQDSNVLRLCTAEALAYLNYLRRFAKVASKSSESQGKGV